MEKDEKNFKSKRGTEGDPFTKTGGKERPDPLLQSTLRTTYKDVVGMDTYSDRGDSHSRNDPP